MNTDNLNLPLKAGVFLKNELNPNGDQCYLYDDSANEIAKFRKESHLNYIVEAVNSHASLVERVRELEEEYKKLFKAYYSEQSRQEFIKECDLLQRVKELEQTLADLREFAKDLCRDHKRTATSDPRYKRAIEALQAIREKKKKEGE